MRYLSKLLIVLIACLLASCVSEQAQLRSQIKAKTCEINLDLPAAERWHECVKARTDDINMLVQKMDQTYAPSPVRMMLEHALSPVAKDPENYLDQEMAEEIKGVAKAAHISMETALFLNLVTESLGGCTSVVVKDKNQGQFLLRNLDFGPALELANLLTEVQFFKGGKPVFKTIAMVGYVGVITGMSEKLALSNNSRPYDGLNARIQQKDGLTIPEYVHPPAALVEAILAKRAQGEEKISFATWEIRKALQENLDYQQFKNRLLTVKRFGAPAYIAAAGSGKNEGFIFARNRNHRSGDENVKGFGEDGQESALRELNDDVHIVRQTNSDKGNLCIRWQAMKKRVETDGSKIFDPNQLLATLADPPVRVIGPHFITLHSSVMNPSTSLMLNRYYKPEIRKDHKTLQTSRPAPIKKD